MIYRYTVKTKILITLGLLCLSGLAGAMNTNEPNQKNLKTALEKYLEQQGDFCLGKFDWPIDVSESEFSIGSRDALQMPVLEKLGLVSSSSASAMRKVDETELAVPVKRFALTKQGKQFFLPKKSVTGVGAKQVVHSHDFCAAKLSLAKIVGWDKPETQGDNLVTTVSYTFKLAVAKWAQDAEIQKVFPLLATIVKGEETMQLKQQFRLEGKNWVPVYPWDN